MIIGEWGFTGQESGVANVTERLVELGSTVGTGLIIEHSTGITYTNQTGGVACLHPRFEGVYVPFENDYSIDHKFLSLEINLSRYFLSTWGTSGATSGITEPDADAIDQFLLDRQLLDWFHVDRTRLNESHEAWIHVTVKSDHAFFCHGFGPYPQPGILTWANSD